MEHIFLKENTVLLKTENGLCKWEFDVVEDAVKLFDLLILNAQIEKDIEELICRSL